MRKNFDELTKLMELLKEWEELKRTHHKELEVEIDSAIKQIHAISAEKGIKIIETLNEIKKNISDYCMMVETFSTFDSREIGEVLEYLVTVFEGEKYFFQNALFKTKNIENTVFDKVEYEIIKTVRIIINRKNKDVQYDYRFNNLNKILNEGKAIIFNEDENELDPNIKFFQSNSTQSNIISKVSYGRFDYVKEFMEMVIDYRMANKKVDISKSELFKLAGEFLAERKDLIEANYQLRIEEQEGDLREKLEQRKKWYLSQLEDIANNETDKPRSI